MRRYIWLLLAVTTIAGLFAPPAQATPSPYAGQMMASVGQSFESGASADRATPLVPDYQSYDPATLTPENKCQHSKYAAAVVVARDFGMQLDQLACAGDEPRHMYDVPRYSNLPQAQRIAPDTDVVVMGVRGNTEFADVIQCVMDPRTECLQGTEGYEQARASLLGPRAMEEQAVYDAVRQRAPDAKRFAMGIPPIAPNVGDDITACKWFLSDGEVVALRDLFDAFNQSIHALAVQNGAAFVDMERAESPWVQGRHDFCSSDAWVWGPRLNAPYDLSAPLDSIGGSFHPTIAGQWARAQVLELTMLEHASA